MTSRAPLSYLPGQSIGICGAGIAVLLDPGAAPSLVRSLFDAIASGADLDDVLDQLLRPGLRAVHGFAAAQWTPAGARVVVRGDLLARVSDGRQVRATGVLTDQFVARPTRVELMGGAPTSTQPMPVLAAVVWAAVVGEEQVAEPVAAGAPGAPGVPQPAPEVWGPSAAQVTSRPAEAAGEQAGWADPAAAVVPPVAPAVFGPGGPAVAVPPAVPGPPVPVPPVPPVPAPAVPLTPVPAPAVPVPPTTPAVPPPATPVPAPASGLIESFPWGPDADPSVAWEPPTAIARTPLPGRAPATADDEAFEMTVDRSRLVQHAAPSATMVVAARCSAGHLSAAYAGVCRVCGRPLPPQQPFEVARPTLGVLRLSNGDVVTLDRGVVMGRNPRLPAGFTGEQPNLLKLADPNKDISSQHLEVSLDYWHVLVTDLGSTNGTEVVLPGQPPVQLRPNDAMMIEPGTRVVLAGVLDFVYEVTG
jgi:hypothetical protein